MIIKYIMMTISFDKHILATVSTVEHYSTGPEREAGRLLFRLKHGSGSGSIHAEAWWRRGRGGKCMSQAAK